MTRHPLRLLVLLAVSFTAIALAVPRPGRRPVLRHHLGVARQAGPVPSRSGRRPALTDVRAGQHACFDRLVLDIAAAAPRSWRVAYVGERHGPDGYPVPLRGGACLQVTAGSTRRLPAANRVSGERRRLQHLPPGRWAGSFEGLPTWAGSAGRLPFRDLHAVSSGTSAVVITSRTQSIKLNYGSLYSVVESLQKHGLIRRRRPRARAGGPSGPSTRSPRPAPPSSRTGSPSCCPPRSGSSRRSRPGCR